jgi:hypothetical protein
MSEARHPREPHDAAPLDRFEEIVRDELARPLATPDFAPRIMERLGYHPISRRQARWARLSRWFNQGAVALAGLAVIAVAASVHMQSARVRRPAGPTLPAAIEAEFDRGSTRVNQLLQQLRELTPAGDVAPVHPGPTGHQDPSWPHDERDSAAPVRWV